MDRPPDSDAEHKADTPATDAGGDGRREPRVPLEDWTVERSFDSSEYLRRRGPWPKWSPPDTGATKDSSSG